MMNKKKTRDRVPGKPKLKRLFSIDEELFYRFKEAAEKNGQSMSSIIVEGIKNYLATQEDPGQ